MNSLATTIRGTASCVWDIESCPIPPGIPGSVVVQRLSELLLQRNQICTGFTAVARSEYLSLHLRSELDSGGVAVLGVNPSTVDIALMNEIIKEVVFRRPPHSIILIGGDRDFSSVIHFLETVKYSVTLIHNQNVLPHRCKDAFPWSTFLALGRRENLMSTLVGTRGNSFPDIRSLELASGRRQQLLLLPEDHFIPPPRETSAPSARTLTPSESNFPPMWAAAPSQSTKQPVMNSNNVAYVFKQKVVNSVRTVELEGAHFPESREKGPSQEFFASTGATGAGSKTIPSAFFARQASMENMGIMNQSIPRRVPSQMFKDPVTKSPSGVDIKSAHESTGTVSPAKKCQVTGFESEVSNSLKSPSDVDVMSTHESTSPSKKSHVSSFESEVLNSLKSPGTLDVKSPQEFSITGTVSPTKRSQVTSFESEGSNSLKSLDAVDFKSALESSVKKSQATGFESDVSKSLKSPSTVDVKSACESTGKVSPTKKSQVSGSESKDITLLSNSLSTEHFMKKPALENRVIVPPTSKPSPEAPQLTAAQIFKQQVLDALRASEMKSASLHATSASVPTKTPQQPVIKPQVLTAPPAFLPERGPSVTPKTDCKTQLSTAAQMFKQKIMNSIRGGEVKTAKSSYVNDSSSCISRSTGSESLSLDSPSTSGTKEQLAENAKLVNFSPASESASTNPTRSAGARSISLDSPSAPRLKEHVAEKAILVSFSHASESAATNSRSNGVGSLSSHSPSTFEHSVENETLVNGPSVSSISTHIPKMRLITDESNAPIVATGIVSKNDSALRDEDRCQVGGLTKHEQTHKKYPKCGERAYNLLRKIQQLAVEKRQSMRDNPVLGADPRVHYLTCLKPSCKSQFDSVKKVVSLAAGATLVLMQLQNCDGSDLIERANVLDLVDPRFHVLVNCMFDLTSGGISVAKEALLTMLSVNLSRFVGQGFLTPLQYCVAALEANVIAGDVTTGILSDAFSLVLSKKARLAESKPSAKAPTSTRTQPDGLLRAQFDYLVEIFKNRGKSALSMPVLIAILGDRRGRFVFRRGGRKFIEIAADAGVVTIYRPKKGRTGDKFVRLMPQSLSASNAPSSRVVSPSLEGAVKTWAEAAGLEEVDESGALPDSDEAVSENESECGGESDSSEQFFQAEEFL
ncbi:hypothetical protein HDU81_006795 [Chytriomyces hyalinus]|nr:hypothetical protein HDU81_006795 [Chytriomyces hyalinus]